MLEFGEIRSSRDYPRAICPGRQPYRSQKRLAALSVFAAVLAAGAGANAAQTASTTCPSGGLTSSTEVITLKTDCTIAGNLDLSGSAALTISGGVLSVKGNVTLSDTAALRVTNGELIFPQTNYNQDSITLNGHSTLTLTGSTIVTNATQSDDFAMTWNANDYSTVTVTNTTLDTRLSWILGKFGDNSTLNMSNAQAAPTEIYPTGSTKVSMSSNSFATVWLEFESGQSGAIQIPKMDSKGDFTLNFGPNHSGNIDYSVSITSSKGVIGLISHPKSNITVNGDGNTTDARVVFGYYVEDNAGPVTVSGLPADRCATAEFTDQGRTLKLNDVCLDPFAWQVYVDQSNNFPVTVTRSMINEIAAFGNGDVAISDCVLQLAAVGAMGPGAKMSISNSQIWSQVIEAQGGGQLTITHSQLNGNFVTAAGAGSKISMVNVVGSRNGAGESCTPVDGYPPHDGGIPLCNPFTPPHQCSQITPPTGGATIAATPAIACPPP